MRNYNPLYLAQQILPTATGTCTDKGRKLNEFQVRDMRERFKTGALPKDLAEEYKLNIQTAWDIVKFRTWKTAGGPRDYSKKPLRGQYLSDTRKKLTKSKAPIA